MPTLYPAALSVCTILFSAERSRIWQMPFPFSLQPLKWLRMIAKGECRLTQCINKLRWLQIKALLQKRQRTVWNEFNQRPFPVRAIVPCFPGEKQINSVCWRWATIKAFNVPNKTEKEGKQLSLVFRQLSEISDQAYLQPTKMVSETTSVWYRTAYSDIPLLDYFNIKREVKWPAMQVNSAYKQNIMPTL